MEYARILSFADKVQRQVEWDGVCLLSICAGALSYNWMAETGVVPADYRGWVAALSVYPWALVSLVKLMAIEDETAWMGEELEPSAAAKPDADSRARAA
jgi:hypothetical protein